MDGFLISLSLICLIQMNDIQNLIHIQSVRTAITVDLMESVIHGKTDQRIMQVPMRSDQCIKHTVSSDIGT